MKPDDLRAIAETQPPGEFRDDEERVMRTLAAITREFEQVLAGRLRSERAALTRDHAAHNAHVAQLKRNGRRGGRRKDYIEQRFGGE